MKPYHLTDPRFPYVNAASTDIRQTFARVRRELAEQSLIPPPKRLFVPSEPSGTAGAAAGITQQEQT